MAEGYAPSINDIVTALSEDPRYMRFKSKFTEKNVKDALITLEYADKEGNYKYSDRGLTEFGHLGHIANQIIKTFPESKSSSPESKSKKKRRRRRGKGNKSVKGGSRRRRN
jgi:hypothetical protein